MVTLCLKLCIPKLKLCAVVKLRKKNHHQRFYILYLDVQYGGVKNKKVGYSKTGTVPNFWLIALPENLFEKIYILQKWEGSIVRYLIFTTIGRFPFSKTNV